MRNHNITPTKAFTFTAFLCSLSGGLHAKIALNSFTNTDFLPNTHEKGLGNKKNDEGYYSDSEDGCLTPTSGYQHQNKEEPIYATIDETDYRGGSLKLPTSTKADSISKREKVQEMLQRALSFNFGSFVKDTVSSITEKKRSGSFPNLNSNDEGSKFSRTFFSQGKLQRSKSFDLGSLRSFVKDTVSSMTKSLSNLTSDSWVSKFSTAFSSLRKKIPETLQRSQSFNFGSFSKGSFSSTTNIEQSESLAKRPLPPRSETNHGSLLEQDEGGYLIPNRISQEQELMNPYELGGDSFQYIVPENLLSSFKDMLEAGSFSRDDFDKLFKNEIRLFKEQLMKAIDPDQKYQEQTTPAGGSKLSTAFSSLRKKIPETLQRAQSFNFGSFSKGSFSSTTNIEQSESLQNQEKVTEL